MFHMYLVVTSVSHISLQIKILKSDNECIVTSLSAAKRCLGVSGWKNPAATKWKATPMTLRTARPRTSKTEEAREATSRPRASRR